MTNGTKQIHISLLVSFVCLSVCLPACLPAAMWDGPACGADALRDDNGAYLHGCRSARAGLRDFLPVPSWILDPGDTALSLLRVPALRCPPLRNANSWKWNIWELQISHLTTLIL